VNLCHDIVVLLRSFCSFAAISIVLSLSRAIPLETAFVAGVSFVARCGVNRLSCRSFPRETHLVSVAYFPHHRCLPYLRKRNTSCTRDLSLSSRRWLLILDCFKSICITILDAFWSMTLLSQDDEASVAASSF
jgi:hypothetical protein